MLLMIVEGISSDIMSDLNKKWLIWQNVETRQ